MLPCRSYTTMRSVCMPRSAGERRAALRACGVLTRLHRHRCQRHAARLQSEHEGHRIGLGHHAALLGKTQPANNECQRSGGGCRNGEAAIVASDGAFERLDDEHVRGVDGSGVRTLNDAAHDTP